MLFSWYFFYFYLKSEVSVWLNFNKMCLGWWKTVFIVWCAMARVWTLFDKLSAIWGLFISLSMDLGAQSAAGCWSDCVKSGHGVSCPSLSQSSAAGVSTGLVWVGRTWAGAQMCLSLVLGQPACPWQEMLVTVSIPHGTALSCLSAVMETKKSPQDTKMFNFYSIKDLKKQFT